MLERDVRNVPRDFGVMLQISWGTEGLCGQVTCQVTAWQSRESRPAPPELVVPVGGPCLPINDDPVSRDHDIVLLLYDSTYKITILLRVRSLRCALRSQLLTSGAMTSPDVFRSSPMRSHRCEALLVNSSSPDLPPVQELLSQIPRRPPIRSGSKVEPIPDGANSIFMGAKEHWKSAQAAPENDHSVIEVDPEPAPKPRVPRRRKQPSQNKSAEDACVAVESSTTDQPWKKYMPSPKSKTTGRKADNIGSEQAPKEGSKVTAKKATKKTGTMSNHFTDRPLQPEPINLDEDESLHLERAANRRVDWTPPAQKQKAFNPIDSEITGVNYINSSMGDDGQAVVFKNLLENYGCSEQPSRDSVPISDEDSSFLKKRKLIEFVNIHDASRSVSPGLATSPTKQKAPKKKPRTITGLATAAYRPATQIEPVLPAESTFNGLPSGPDAEAGSKSKTKPQSRKKPAKKSKKKPPPPKPILLSPDAALKQVSKQDFVFGTSSQLVREQSPSLLRDIHSAIQKSTETELGDCLEPLNSDAIETSEQRQQLWEAAARDADGQLFDAEIIDLVDGSPRRLSVDNGDDPFGYFKAGGEQRLVTNGPPSPHCNSFETLSDILPSPAKKNASKKPSASRRGETQTKAQPSIDRGDGNSFETLSDILPSPAKQPPEIIDDDSPFSSSQISVSTDIQRGDATAALKGQKPSAQSLVAVTSQLSRPTPDDAPQEKHPRPTYELYSDAQLSKEITSYGFKPVKRRTAMIALLDQCWQSKTHVGPAHVRTLATSTGSSQTLAITGQGTTSPKRARGRPRKNSAGLSESQEPPPSAQPSESPKRPRGRPRKISASLRGASPDGTDPPRSGQPHISPKRPRGRPRKDSISPSRPPSPVKSKARPKAKTSGKASKVPGPPHPSTPPRKPTISKTVVEIPDSESENESDISASATSSPEQTFSPPPGVDLSVSMEEDSELPLTMMPDDKQAVLFERITEAVTSAPRSTDPAKPSWYEKILLYDPIVLEDLTSWLNSGQLTRVGHDGEISPGEVKKWCEAKSVCCLWRVNLRGKERKRL